MWDVTRWVQFRVKSYFYWLHFLVSVYPCFHRDYNHAMDLGFSSCRYRAAANNHCWFAPQNVRNFWKISISVDEVLMCLVLFTPQRYSIKKTKQCWQLRSFFSFKVPFTGKVEPPVSFSPHQILVLWDGDRPNLQSQSKSVSIWQFGSETQKSAFLTSRESKNIEEFCV